MKFAIITHVNHTQNNDGVSGYAPYVREMNIWLKDADEVIIVAPLATGIPTLIDMPYKGKINFWQVSAFDFMSFKNIWLSIFKLPKIFWVVFLAMKRADHVHLRCPGNMGLIGCIVQIFFPHKKKTAKYAGNWDPQSKQPWTYKLQRKILNNTFLTRNMQVLVYGDWIKRSKNIKPFFTATYSQDEKETIEKSSINLGAEFIFVGSLVKGKNPMYAIKLVEKLVQNGRKVVLNLYGNGEEKPILENYIKENQLEKLVFLHGNQNKETVKKAYQKSHFVILPSRSEGWPKAVAEGMFWGCVPLSTNVSCIPYMLDYGKRGILLKMNLEQDLAQIVNLLLNENCFMEKSKTAIEWSQKFTIDVFEEEIKKLLVK
ncbi:glycosyltransferase [Flavobacterium branchiicola]|uniref:Glycosyltransferase n=1 Tax=Flavobacterium branchiicola TaxID=1114875 RepID=A0ABV9PJH3_9FLAO|nr:glycosyltransferase [Flavobacterium branchiicola]MBS7255492.1 glycosyltransferase [Flavobacterium branchiicola]